MSASTPEPTRTIRRRASASRRRRALAALACVVLPLIAWGCAPIGRPAGEHSPGPRSPGPSDSLVPASRVDEAVVTRVIDGDTIEVRIGDRRVRVRYIGIDAPESVRPGSPVEFMGREAADENRRLVAGRTVLLERDVSETDRFGRLLRYVWLRQGDRWSMVNLALVGSGHAQTLTIPPDVRFADAFLAAERRARTAGLGLWAGQPSSRSS